MNRLPFLAALLVVAACADNRRAEAPGPVPEPESEPPSAIVSVPVAVVPALSPSPPPVRPLREAPVRSVPLRASLAIELPASPSGSTRVTEVRFVTAKASLSGVQGESEARVDFLTPGGVPYEFRKVKLASAATQDLKFNMPVAATLIETDSIAGRWSAVLSVDGNAIATHEWELTP